MGELFTLQQPWWTIFLRALLVYAGLLLLIRLSGKRTVGKFTPFDLVVVILIGEAAQNGLIGDDHSVLGAAIAAGSLIGINGAIGWISARFPRMERLFDGTPKVLARNGTLLPGVLRANNLSPAEFDQALRNARCTLQDVWVALLETDGEISVIRQTERAPLP